MASRHSIVALAIPLLLGCPSQAPAPASAAEPTPSDRAPTSQSPAGAPEKPAKTEPEPAAPASVLAGVDLFGVHTVSRQEVLEVIDLALGEPADINSDRFRETLAAAKTRLEERFEFAFVQLSPISYFAGPDAGTVYVTVDVVERGDEARMRFAAEPTGQVDDPAGLIAAWIEYHAKAAELMRSGELDLSEGATCRGGFHCALGFGHPDLEAYEERFLAEVPSHFAQLRRALRRDRDAEKRATAAFLLAYGEDLEQVIEALVPSIDDPSMLVRNNVLRVLLMAQGEAETALVPLEPLLRALRSPRTTDRNKAGYALANLVEKSPARFKRQILDEVGDVLLEMAAMSQPNNRDPALQILRALSGQDHGADVDAWRRWIEENR